jgi:hypothetical protein
MVSVSHSNSSNTPQKSRSSYNLYIAQHNIAALHHRPNREIVKQMGEKTSMKLRNTCVNYEDHSSLTIPSHSQSRKLVLCQGEGPFNRVDP